MYVQGLSEMIHFWDAPASADGECYCGQVAIVALLQVPDGPRARPREVSLDATAVFW